MFSFQHVPHHLFVIKPGVPCLAELGCDCLCRYLVSFTHPNIRWVTAGCCRTPSPPSISPSQLCRVTGLILLVSHWQNMHVQCGAEQVCSVIPHSLVLQEVSWLTKLQSLCSSLSWLYLHACQGSIYGIHSGKHLWLRLCPSTWFLFYFLGLGRLTLYQKMNHILEIYPGPSILVSWWNKENIITGSKK